MRAGSALHGKLSTGAPAHQQIYLYTKVYILTWRGLVQVVIQTK